MQNKNHVPQLPDCPECGEILETRTDTNGVEFQHCFSCEKSRFALPRDRGASPIDRSPATKHGGDDLASIQLPVRWSESFDRLGFQAKYVPVGSLPGLVSNVFRRDQDIAKTLSHTLILRRNDRRESRASSDQKFVPTLMKKLLQRGLAPLPSLDIERQAIKESDISGIEDASNEVELGWILDFKTANHPQFRREFLSALCHRRPFSLDPQISSQFDSEAERKFINNWVPEQLGPDAGHWFNTQAPLEKLVDETDARRFTKRRVDFLVSKPNVTPFVVEIDGPTHVSSRHMDRSRDDALRTRGYEVVRVPVDEINNGHGRGLDRIKALCNENAMDAKPTTLLASQTAELAWRCSFASKLQFVLADALELGWIEGSRWKIAIEGGGEVEAMAVIETLRMISAYDGLYGSRVAPQRCDLLVNSTKWAWHCENGIWESTDTIESDVYDLRVKIEPDSSPFDSLEIENVDFIIRPAHLPVSLAVGLPPTRVRTSIQSPSSVDALQPLTFFLQHIFRKKAFRPRQCEAIWRTLAQQDSLVLLPTGAGKSIIYQLAGLLTHGVTLVVDPTVALIDDQIEGLRRYGIDRALGIHSQKNLNPRNLEKRLELIAQGEVQFLIHTPERMHIPSYQDALTKMKETTVVNLVVVDEAHCVSEWGHEFRPAYLRLADTVREICKDQRRLSPPVLGLTGTASDQVLNDLRNRLGIEEVDSVMRPDTFDRPELEFRISRCKTIGAARDVYAKVLAGLPSEFNDSPASFFSPRGNATTAGIVYVRTVTGGEGNLSRVKGLTEEATGSEAAVYSGRRPSKVDSDETWFEVKKENARRFGDDDVALMVATKAYGMGIDKPNVRYIVHYGMPGSIESYYQEAGRAGRDGKRSVCHLIFAEFERERSEKLTGANIELSTLRSNSKQFGDIRSERDDITLMAYFHCSNFVSPKQDKRYIDHLLKQLPLEKGDMGVHVSRPNSEDLQKAHDYAVIRLLDAGVLTDYKIDYQNAQYVLDVARFDADVCRDRVVDYVRRAGQKYVAQQIRKRVDELVERDNRTLALQIASVLVDFRFDVMEGARRAMYREAVQLARNCDTDSEIRNEILSYLNADVIADPDNESLESRLREQFNTLLAQETVVLEDWATILTSVECEAHAAWLRGLSARMFESYPRHPGLQLVRAGSEAMTERPDMSEAQRFLHEMIERSNELEIPNAEIVRAFGQLTDGDNLLTRKVMEPVAMMLIDLEYSHPLRRELERIVLAAGRKWPGSRVQDLSIAYLLQRAATTSSVATHSWAKRYSGTKTRRLLGIGTD